MRDRLYNIVCAVMAGVATLFMVVPGYAADSKTTARASWKAGIEAYNAKDYAEAVEAFETVVASGYASADVYYNLANAYFKLGQQSESSRPFAGGELGRAVLNYERALRLDPTMDDARYNLDIAKDLTNDTEAVPESFIVRVWHYVAGIMTTNGWVTLSLVMLGVTAVMVLLYLLHDSVTLRKISFFVSLATTVVFILSTIFSIVQLRASDEDNSAVIITHDTTPVHASPDSGSKIIREPSQGVTVEVEREQGEWSEVRFADGEKGWVRTTNVEII